MNRILTLFLLLGFGMLALPAVTRAQDAAPLTLTLDEAVQIAMVQNRAIKRLRLDVDNAAAQVKEGWGKLLPQIDVNASYTRSVKSINPFTGSQAGGLFNTLGFIDWLAFNEQARTDGNPATDPITVAEFFARQQAGLDAAGVQTESGGNPFAIPNQFRNTLSITQKLFDGRALWGASGASRYLEPFTEKGLARQEQLLVERVKDAYYRALLAEAREAVARQSVARTEATLNEVARRVAQGVTPKFQRLSTEVELANLETNLVQARNESAQSKDDLKRLLGIPMDRPVRLRGALDAEDPAAFTPISVQAATDLAVERRPDLEQARINIELQQVQLQVARSEFLPEINAFANISYIGSVPDNRRFFFSNPDDPFSFQTGENGFFSSNYWAWDVNVGFRLTWNLFNGFQTRQRLQQRKIAKSQAELDYEELADQIRLEVERAARDLAAARKRLDTQRRNVDRAELNYSYAESRLGEGVASPLEVREASEQLDMSRWNYLQALHDVLVARTALETAMGMPVNGGGAFQLTTMDQ